MPIGSFPNPYAVPGAVPQATQLPYALPTYGQPNLVMPQAAAFGMQPANSMYPQLPIAAMGQMPPMAAPVNSTQAPGFFTRMGRNIGNFMQQGVQYAQDHPMIASGAAMGVAGGMMGCPYSACMGAGSIMMGLAQSPLNPMRQA